MSTFIYKRTVGRKVPINNTTVLTVINFAFAAAVEAECTGACNARVKRRGRNYTVTLDVVRPVALS